MVTTGLNLFSTLITVSTIYTPCNLNSITIGTVQDIFYRPMVWYQANLVGTRITVTIYRTVIWIAHTWSIQKEEENE